MLPDSEKLHSSQIIFSVFLDKTSYIQWPITKKTNITVFTKCIFRVKESSAPPDSICLYTGLLDTGRINYLIPGNQCVVKG